MAGIRLSWSKMKPEDIINWPSDVRFIPVQKMKLYELKSLHKLVKEDILEFSPEFLRLKESQFSKIKSPKSELQDMIRDIETALCNKLNAGSNKSFSRVPWAVLRKGDIINWPKEIPLVWLSTQSKKRLRLLHKLREKFDFSKDFRKALYKNTSFISDFHKAHYRNEVRSDVTKYLRDKLAKKLNVNRIKVPWSEMKAEDIINWPPDMKFKRINVMNKNDLEILQELAKKDLLDFSPEFLKRRHVVNQQRPNNGRLSGIMKK
jgi:hypothetical protein